MDQLYQAGWSEGRCASKQLEEFQVALGPTLHSAARKVLLEFADLMIGRRVFFDFYYVKLALNEGCKLPLFLRNSICPVALTSYWSDTSVWIDERGRVFLLEPDELSYFAGSMDAALEILVLCGEPESVPQELRPGRWEIEMS